MAFPHVPTKIDVGISPQFFGFCPTTYRGLYGDQVILGVTFGWGQLIVWGIAFRLAPPSSFLLLGEDQPIHSYM
jgi:hypothetical protein